MCQVDIIDKKKQSRNFQSLSTDQYCTTVRRIMKNWFFVLGWWLANHFKWLQKFWSTFSGTMLSLHAITWVMAIGMTKKNKNNRCERRMVYRKNSIGHFFDFYWIKLLFNCRSEKEMKTITNWFISFYLRCWLLKCSSSWV